MIAQNIRIARERLKMTQEELAEKTGIPMIAAIESGAEPTVVELHKIAEALYVEFEELLGELGPFPDYFHWSRV